MKPLILFVACLLTASSVLADDAVLKLRLGKSIHVPAPADYPISPGGWVRFSARVTNTSKRSFWLAGWPGGHPMYGLSTRSTPTTAWTQDDDIQLDGAGADLHPLAPGATMSFSVRVPIRYVGQQVRIEMSPYQSYSGQKPFTTITSKPATVR